MSTNDDFLVQVLADRARQAARSTKSDLLDVAIDAAVEHDLERRSWKLVVLAAQLRSAADHTRALAVLDAVVGLGPSWEVQAAAFTTAAAVHCDRNELDTARAICEQTLARGVDEHLLRVSVRVYWELFRSTKLEEFKSRWEQCSKLLADMEAVPAA